VPPELDPGPRPPSPASPHTPQAPPDGGTGAQAWLTGTVAEEQLQAFEGEGGSEDDSYEKSFIPPRDLGVITALRARMGTMFPASRSLIAYEAARALI
jgi:hypothetical protein